MRCLSSDRSAIFLGRASSYPLTLVLCRCRAAVRVAAWIYRRQRAQASSAHAKVLVVSSPPIGTANFIACECRLYITSLARLRSQQPPKRNHRKRENHSPHVVQGEGTSGLSSGRLQHGEEEPGKYNNRGEWNSYSVRPKQGTRQDCCVREHLAYQGSNPDHARLGAPRHERNSGRGLSMYPPPPFIKEVRNRRHGDEGDPGH
jgi:hypothetical protein